MWKLDLFLVTASSAGWGLDFLLAVLNAVVVGGAGLTVCWLMWRYFPKDPHSTRSAMKPFPDNMARDAEWAWNLTPAARRLNRGIDERMLRDAAADLAAEFNVREPTEQDEYIGVQLASSVDERTLQHIAAELVAALDPYGGDAPEPVGDVTFKADEPRTLDEFEGQRHIVRPLALAVKALAPDRVVLEHKLLTGQPGLGKTLMAKVLANTLRERAERLGLVPPVFVETYAANLNGVDALDQVARQLERTGGIWFIDEIHVLNKELATKLYLLMEDGRYAFEGTTTPRPMPHVMVMGATTDYGGLHAALKRRFGEPLHVRAMTVEELLAMLPRFGMPIAPRAAELLVSRCHQSGAPYELKILFRECAVFATAEDKATITEEVVTDVLTTYEIDEHGLRPLDRAVLHALFQRPRYRGKAQEFYCYGASESDVCAVARLDRVEFQETVRPRLLSRGFLEVRAGVGLALTPRAVAEYARLHQ